jgi:hypothetical protein
MARHYMDPRLGSPVVMISRPSTGRYVGTAHPDMLGPHSPAGDSLQSPHAGRLGCVCHKVLPRNSDQWPLI